MIFFKAINNYVLGKPPPDWTKELRNFVTKHIQVYPTILFDSKSFWGHYSKVIFHLAEVDHTMHVSEFIRHSMALKKTVSQTTKRLTTGQEISGLEKCTQVTETDTSIEMERQKKILELERIEKKLEERERKKLQEEIDKKRAAEREQLRNVITEDTIFAKSIAKKQNIVNKGYVDYKEPSVLDKLEAACLKELHKEQGKKEKKVVTNIN